MFPKIGREKGRYIRRTTFIKKTLKTISKSFTKFDVKKCEKVKTRGRRGHAAPLQEHLPPGPERNLAVGNLDKIGYSIKWRKLPN